jgi:hypothetical protein
MRRSSWLVLTLTFMLLIVVCLLSIYFADFAAAAMTTRQAVALIERGKTAFEQGDADGIMDLLAPEARLFRRDPPQLRTGLERAIADVGSGHLSVAYSDVMARPDGRDAIVTLDITVGEKLPAADVVYYRGRLALRLIRIHQPQWMGLYNTEEWRILKVDISPPIDLPDV